MARSLIDKQLVADLDGARSTAFLTPNMRIARQLHTSYGVAQQAIGKSIWRSPNVLALQSWLDVLWAKAQDAALPSIKSLRIANKVQVHSVWEAALAADDYQTALVQPAGVAEMAMDAYNVLRQWRLALADVRVDSFETERFTVWAADVESRMLSYGWVTSDGANDLLIQAISDGHLPLPNEVVRIEFDEITPQMESLFSAIEDAGCQVRDVSVASSQADARRVRVETREGQYYAAAQWAKGIVRADPEATIGIVCPELSARRDEILQSFNDVFEPQWILPYVHRRTPPVNISAGIPLMQTPVVASAMDFLHLTALLVPVGEMSAFVRSPFLGGAATEVDGRALLDLRARKSGATYLSLEGVNRLITKASHDLSSRIESLCVLLRSEAGQMRASQWVTRFREILKVLGWPGDRVADSEEYQAVSTLLEVLDYMSTLDPVYGHCSRSKALTLLSRLARDRVFQPETKDSPVQILGVLEGAGLQFDHLWVMDFNDNVWPARPSPNPYLSLPMQRDLRMPRCDADRELAYAKRLTDRLLAGARDIMISFAGADGEREMRCSRLADGIDLVELHDVDLAPRVNYAAELFGSTTLASIENTQDPVSAEDTGDIRGGASLLARQANCPFSAYAYHRLGAREMPKEFLGLRPAERGDLAHLSAQRVWERIKSHSELIKLGAGAKAIIVEDAVTSSLAWIKQRRPDLGPRLLGIERSRLSAILRDLLEVETRREPFTVVSCEKHVEGVLGGLPVALRLDRVDKLESGEEILLDYKSSIPTLAKWTGDRVVEPQVPAYVACFDGAASGAGFIQLKRGSVEYAGLANREGAVTGFKTPSSARYDFPDTWEETVSGWRESLDRAGSDFMEGDCTVAPARNDSCRFCHMADLCRKRSAA